MAKSSKQEKRLSDQKISSDTKYTPDDLKGGRILMEYVAALDRVNKKQVKVLKRFYEVGEDGIEYYLYRRKPIEFAELEYERKQIVEKIHRVLCYDKKE